MDENQQHLLLSSDSGATLVSVDPLTLRYQTLRDDGSPLATLARWKASLICLSSRAATFASSTLPASTGGTVAWLKALTTSA